MIAASEHRRRAVCPRPAGVAARWFPIQVGWDAGLPPRVRHRSPLRQGTQRRRSVLCALLLHRPCTRRCFPSSVWGRSVDASAARGWL